MFKEIKTSSGDVTSVTYAQRYASIRNFGGVISVYNTAGTLVDTFKVADTAPVYFIDLDSKEPGAAMTAADLGSDALNVELSGSAAGIYVSANDSHEALAIYVLSK